MMHSKPMRFIPLLIAAMVFVAGAAHAQEAGPRVFVLHVAGAVRPFNQSFARYVADEAQALGIDASADAFSDSSLLLVGTAKTATTKKGAMLTVRWSLLDPEGAEIVAYTVEGIAPYRASNPWEAIDGDTLRWFAAASARELEYALQFTLPPSPPPRIARAGPVLPASKAEAADQGEATSALFTRVHVAGVKGAPGDGNQALAQALAQYLGRHDIVLVPRKEADAYVIEGQVSLAKANAAEDNVSILWRLADAKGRELARIEQANAVPAGSLGGRWGETAVFAAEGAADGLLDAMEKIGPRPPGG